MKRCAYLCWLLSVLCLVGGVTLASPAEAQFACQLGSSGGYAAPDSPASPLAMRVMQDVQARLCPGGCGTIDFAANHGVPNAVAIMRGVGHTSIRYQPRFMNAVAQTYGQDAAAGILAHEFGHHIDFLKPASWMSHAWGKELRADAWSGCYLARAGLGAQKMEASLRAIAAYPSPSHPAWPSRIVALRKGYVACGGRFWRHQWGGY